MMIKAHVMVLLTLSGVHLPANAAPTPRGQAIATSCAGKIAEQGKLVAKTYKLRLGTVPKACFGKMQIYDGADYQYVVVAPDPACPKGSAIDVYGNSRAGPWYSFFEKPVCGANLSIGPKNPWGDWMLTIDDRHYDSRGAYYVPVKY